MAPITIGAPWNYPAVRLRLRAAAVAVLLVVICLMPVLLYLPVLHEPLQSDEGTFAIVARTMLAGGLPYRDAFNVNPPLLYAWYALSFALFGEHVWAPRLLVALCLSLTTVLVYVQAWLLFSHRRAHAATFAFALATGIPTFWPSAQPEHFLLLPLVGALVAITLGWQRGTLRRSCWPASSLISWPTPSYNWRRPRRDTLSTRLGLWKCKAVTVQIREGELRRPSLATLRVGRFARILLTKSEQLRRAGAWFGAGPCAIS